MTPIHIIGQPGSGKTTLVADLVTHLTGRGHKVGTIKHSSHSHELDKPGKDSYIHRTAGASPAAMVTRKMAAVYLPASKATRPESLIERYFKDVDILLIEGWISGPYEKIEVRRMAVDKPPLFPDVPTVTTLVLDETLSSDDALLAKSRQIICLFRSDISRIADHIERLSTN